MSLTETQLAEDPDGWLEAHSVYVSGNFAMVGDMRESSRRGSVSVFNKINGTWVFQRKLVAQGGTSNDYFGADISISGDTAVIGAFGADGNSIRSGAAYVFKYNGTTWVQRAKLVANNGYADDEFGASVSISGDTIVVGARAYDNYDTNEGAAYIFSKVGEGWVQSQKLQAYDRGRYHYFGSSVSIDGNALVIGAPSADGLGTDTGAAYIYARGQNYWGRKQKLRDQQGGSGDNYGSAVAVSGQVIAVGLPDDSDYTGVTKAGAVQIFRNINGYWEKEDTLANPSPDQDDSFGTSVEYANNILIVGAKGDDVVNSNAGTAYAFGRIDGVWTLLENLTASNGAYEDKFGSSVSFGGDQILIGASSGGVGYFYTVNSILGPQDEDGDGLLDSVEKSLGTDPQLYDTDGDQLNDYLEVNFDNDPYDYETGVDTNPLEQDTDDDGSHDYEEVSRDGDPSDYQPGVDTDPNNPDTDGDTLLDGLDPNPLVPEDTDGDGIPDHIEASLGTNPLLADSDTDTISDYDEVNQDGNPNDYQAGVDTNPLSNDTDSDGLLDAVDANPLVARVSLGVTYYHNDALGSAVAGTDETGNVVWRENYLPYGGKRDSELSTVDQAISYTGKPHDEGTGLSYYGARYYDTASGRFLSMDPAALDPENIHLFNRYSYAANNPYRYVDPDGELFFVPILFFLAKEVASEAFEQATGIPVGVKGLAKAAARKGAKMLGKEVAKGGSAGAMKRLEFVASPKHGSSARQTSKGVSNPGPANGQHALNNSLQVKSTSPRRVGVDKANNEVVVFDQTSQGIFHGHTRSFKELTSQQQSVLRKSGMVDRKGNIR